MKPLSCILAVMLLLAISSMASDGTLTLKTDGNCTEDGCVALAEIGPNNFLLTCLAKMGECGKLSTGRYSYDILSDRENPYRSYMGKDAIRVRGATSTAVYCTTQMPKN